MQRITIGAVTGVFGIKGYMKVKSLVENEDIFNELKHVAVKRKDGTVSEMSVESMKPHSSCWLLKFAGVDTPEDAMSYRGSALTVPLDMLPEISEDEVYWAHIKGFPVLDSNGVRVGVLEDLIETGSYDVFQIAGDDGEEYMISTNPSHVLKIDVENKAVIIDRIGLVGKN